VFFSEILKMGFCLSREKPKYLLLGLMLAVAYWLS